MVLDHYISFKYMSAGDLKRTSNAQMSDPSEARPGWYLRAYSNEGYTDIVKYTYVEPQAMEKIAEAVVENMPPGRAQQLVGAVRAANVQHAQDLKRSQEFLEKRIAEDTELLKRIQEEQS